MVKDPVKSIVLRVPQAHGIRIENREPIAVDRHVLDTPNVPEAGALRAGSPTPGCWEISHKKHGSIENWFVLERGFGVSIASNGLGPGVVSAHVALT
jgi:hypothetical protein